VEKKAATSAKKAKDRTVPKSYDQRSSQKKATTTSTSSSSAKGKFWVIAGNFENKQWAKSEVAKFKKLGYKAEIVHFERSNFHTVCVGKYGQKSEANWLVKKLKQKHKVDSYIHKKN